MKTIIVDVDGTLVDVSGLREWVTGKNKNYDRFHELAEFAPPIQWVIDHVNRRWTEGWIIVLLTARNDKHLDSTRRWLDKFSVEYDELYMRKDGDFRPDYEVKKEFLEQIRASRPRHDIVYAIDDNPNVIALWKEELIPVLEVPGWED